MASIFKRTTKRLIPQDAEIVERRRNKVARWVDQRGRKHEAELAGDGISILVESPIWTARYRDADGMQLRRSTKCRDKQAAQQVLNGWLAEVEKITAGIITKDESNIASHAGKGIGQHVKAYLDYLKAKTVRGRAVSAKHRRNVESQLNRLIADCGFRSLNDVTRAAMVRWMNQQKEIGKMAGRTINIHRATIVAFCAWAVTERRLTTNLLQGLPKADETEKRRNRRALSDKEIAQLLQAAEDRPLRDAQTIRRGKNKGELLVKLSDDEQRRLTRLGQTRRLIYRTFIYTGLRKGELASLTVGDVYLDGETPRLHLSAKHSKSAQSAQIPLRQDLAEALENYLAEELRAYQERTFLDGRSTYPTALPSDRRLFSIPADFIRVFDRDLKAAGIDKTDTQGRTLDVHCLRHTFATLLSRAKVAPRTAQELLRHSDIRLTMQTYTHLELLDTAHAVESLPEIETLQEAAASLTGTDGEESPDFSRTKYVSSCSQNLSSSGHGLSRSGRGSRMTRSQEPLVNRTQKQPQSCSDRGCQEAGDESRTHNIQLGRLTL